MRTLILTVTLMGCIESSLNKQDGDIDNENDTGTPSTPGDDSAEPKDTGDAPEDTGEPSIPPVGGSIAATDGVVMDPKLSGEPTLGFAMEADEEGCEVSARFDNGIGQRVTISGTEVQWDGTDEDGLWFEPGPARAQAVIDCGDGAQNGDSLALHIVRLGIQAIDFHSPEGDDGNIALAFHKSSLTTGGVSPVGDRPEYALSSGTGAALGAVDDDLGEPRTTARWTDPDTAPWASTEPDAHNIPAAYVASSAIQATVTMGAQAISQSRLIAVDALGPRSDEVPTLRLTGSEATISAGGSLTIDLEPAWATMGKEVRTVSWQFESVDAEGTVTPIPGHIETEHTLYTLAGQPALLDGTAVDAAPAIPWIGVLEDTADALEGVEATPAAVLDAVRDYLFEHEYIIYDPGDGEYTDFTGSYIYWSSITADLTGFLDRSGGLNLYCHSMSCLLSAIAGNVGVEAEQIVLGVGFNTNQTRAAGSDSWRRWSFNSHSVVTPDGGDTIWDSSIAMDGDDDPYSEPIEEVMPRGMPGDEYFWRLTYDDISIVNGGLCYIR